MKIVYFLFVKTKIKHVLIVHVDFLVVVVFEIYLIVYKKAFNNTKKIVKNCISQMLLYINKKCFIHSFVIFGFLLVFVLINIDMFEFFFCFFFTKKFHKSSRDICMRKILFKVFFQVFKNLPKSICFFFLCFTFFWIRQMQFKIRTGALNYCK